VLKRIEITFQMQFKLYLDMGARVFGYVQHCTEAFPEDIFLKCVGLPKPSGNEGFIAKYMRWSIVRSSSMHDTAQGRTFLQWSNAPKPRG